MSAEDNVIEQILIKFPFLENKILSPRPGRVISPPLMREHFEQALDYVVEQVGFNRFHFVIGVDDGEDLGAIYMLSNTEHVVLLLKQKAPKSNPRIGSICGRFPNALWHERELVDLFGMVVENLPPGPNYPLPDGWPKGNYPMRKEWKVEYFDRETLTYNPPDEQAEAAAQAPGKEAAHE